VQLDISYHQDLVLHVQQELQLVHQQQLLLHVKQVITNNLHLLLPVYHVDQMQTYVQVTQQ
jgi:hypothetical protein